MGSVSSKQVEQKQTTAVDGNNVKLEKQFVDRFSRLDVESSPEPISKNGQISLNNISAWESKASTGANIKLARNLFPSIDFSSVMASRDVKIADSHIFNTQLNFFTNPITSQNSSGRCWLFATTNVLRYNVMKQLNLKDFELSQVSSDSCVTVNHTLSCRTRNSQCSSACAS